MKGNFPLRVVTHNGPFHADDVLAVALLKTFVRKDLEILRTRDESEFKGNFVVDVGGKHDPENFLFDHHQFRRPADRARSRFMPKVPLSSAGMVLEWVVDQGLVTAEVGEVVYRELVASVDLHDNGEAGAPDEGLPHGASLSAAISRMNPNWDEEKDFDGAFKKAVAFANNIVQDAVNSARATVKARSLVSAAIAKNEDPDILVMEIAVPGAREILVEQGAGHKLIVHPSDFGGWMVMTVPPTLERAFEQRVSLPAEWAGLRGSALNEKLAEAGIDLGTLAEGTTSNPTSVFCHTGRFCGGHGTREAAIAMAKVVVRPEGK